MDLSKKTQRTRGEVGKLYTTRIGEGLFLAYRRSVRRGNWVAKLKCPGDGFRYDYQQLGEADDSAWGGFQKKLSYDQAIDAARTWAKLKESERTGEVVPGAYTVKQAMADYLKASETQKGKKLDRTRYAIDRHIIPTLGTRQLSELRHSHVSAWRDALVTRRKRSKLPDTAESLRKRRSTANRVWTVLRAGLNHAFKEGRVANDSAWARIVPYKAVDAPKVRYLTVDKIKRLIEFCPSEFRPMIQAPIYTGMRYGEVCALLVGDFNGESIHIGRSKGGKPRWIPLTDEGKAFFAGVCAGRDANEIMFTHTQGRHKGQPWDHSQQTHWMQAACEFADIKPAISYHGLRHCYGSHLAMNNVPMHVIAALLGHANGDLRMVTKHYAHLSADYISDQLKASLPSFT